MARGRRMGLTSAGLIASLAGALAIFAGAGAADPEHASAAGCGSLVVTGTTDLRIEGDFGVGGCGESDENFSVFCGAGTVKVDYYVNGNFQGTTDTTVACGVPTRITVDGYLGGDLIDLTRVSAANGFTGITQPNRPMGSFGNDVLYGSAFPDAFAGGPGSEFVFARDGGADNVDCGDDFDFAQTDRAGVDSLSGCEFTDVLPTPALAAGSATGSTTASPPAAKKCKKRKHGRKRKCKKR